MNNLLSVIIPIYNCEANLEKCIESIIKQTYKNLEIILINDGSTDNSLQICNEYKKKDDRIRVFSKKNSGVSAARNVGLDMARGQYITFVDADDYLDLNAYETALNNFKNNEAVFFSYRELFNKEKIIKTNYPKKTGIVSAEEALYQCLFFDGYQVMVWNKIFLSSKVKDLKFITKFHLSEDEIWMIEATKRLKRINLIPDALYNYNEIESSATHNYKNNEKKWYNLISAREHVYEILKGYKRVYKNYPAKIYNDLFHLKWYAYVANDEKNYKKINNYLNKYRSNFYKSNIYSVKRKIKYIFIELLLIIKAPNKVIEKIGLKTSYKMKKVFLKKIKKSYKK